MKNKIEFFQEACVVACLLFAFIGCQPTEHNDSKTGSSLGQLEHMYIGHLRSGIFLLDSLLVVNDREKMLDFYLGARDQFKLAEPIMAFVDKENHKSLNQPNILKVDEEDLTAIKIKEPFGFQVIEEMLFEEPVDRSALSDIAMITRDRMKLVAHNTKLDLEPYHVLWLIRDQIVRVALTGITGFDSPVLERSLDEAVLSYESIAQILGIYQDEFRDTSVLQKWQDEIAFAQATLSGEFNSFDRYEFIKAHTHSQLELLVRTAEDWEIEYPLELALDQKATSLFSATTFNLDFFTDYRPQFAYTNAKADLGRQLFNDTDLSASGKMSCATCHQKDRAFTDGLVTFEGQKRNTPTLTYAALQKGFFYDSRSGSLEGQIVSVVNDEKEFHSDLQTLTDAVKSDPEYIRAFDSVYGGVISDQNIRNAIGSYIRSLAPFDSKFDRNINDQENSLTAREINGFNLFMGKAKCATCHFPPVFNGTVPPTWTDTELESIGVPDHNGEGSDIDDDPGRYNLFGTEERRHFFKTPTVRNVSLTAPYMHNGVYRTLEELMDFYNNGGGAGLGIELEYQTLPPDSLQLTTDEIGDIILFMEALEDAGVGRKISNVE